MTSIHPEFIPYFPVFSQWFYFEFWFIYGEWFDSTAQPIAIPPPANKNTLQPFISLARQSLDCNILSEDICQLLLFISIIRNPNRYIRFEGEFLFRAGVCLLGQRSATSNQFSESMNNWIQTNFDEYVSGQVRPEWSHINLNKIPEI